MLKGFKDFIMRGNVVELAVAVVIGAAFGKVVTAFVDIIMSLLGKLGGQPDFNGWKPGDIPVGAFLTALVGFLIVAAAIYFAVVAPLNAIAARRKKNDEENEAPSDEVRLLQEIRDALQARGGNTNL